MYILKYVRDLGRKKTLNFVTNLNQELIPVICLMYLGIVSCDLLIINYLCGRITNPRSPGFETTCVVICSELTTFAVESPTSWLGDCTSYQMSHHLSRSRRSRPFYIHSYTRTPFQSSIWLYPILQIRHQVTHYLNMEDGWKITLSFELSSSPYHIHLQPVTLFLEDMADFFTRSVFISARVNWWDLLRN